MRLKLIILLSILTFIDHAQIAKASSVIPVGRSSKTMVIQIEDASQVPRDQSTEAECKSCEFEAKKAGKSRMSSGLIENAKKIEVVAKSKVAVGARDGDSAIQDVINYSKDHKLARACENFIESDGGYGDWGKALVAEMKDWDATLGEPIFSKPKGGANAIGDEKLMKACPRFSEFGKDEMYQFYAVFFMHLASVESSCRPSADSYATERRHEKKTGDSIQINPGQGVGLFQMENSVRQRLGRDMLAEDVGYDKGPCLGSRKKPHNMRNPIMNIKCAVAIFANQLISGKKIINNVGYWGPLKTKRFDPLTSRYKYGVHPTIAKVFSAYTPCKKVVARSSK